MSTAKFRNMISNFNRYVPYTKTWNSYNTLFLSARQSGKGLREQLWSKPSTIPEDIIVRDMIDNIDFWNLYRSIEFRKMLKARIDYYEKNQKTKVL